MNSSTRFLLFLMIASTVVVSGLWIMGGKKNEYSTTLLINAQPQQVFPYLTQPQMLKQWIEGLEQVEELSPIEEPQSRPNKTTRVISDQSGNQTRYKDEVIRYDEDKMVSVQSSNPSQIITWIYQLEPDSGKTRLNYRVKTAHVGMGRIWGPLQHPDMESRIVDEARRLKELVEKNEPELEPASDNKTLYEVPFLEDATIAGAPGSPVN